MNKEDLAFWKFGFDVFQTLVMLGVSIYVWILSKAKVNSNKIEQLEERHTAKIAELEEKHRKELAAVNTELAAIKTTIKHMPDREQISRIHKRIDELSEGVHAMQGGLKGVTDNTAMILDALIKKGGDN